ncbi:hypothetical protein DFH08DRAFT_805571 [Mycena albidolilacea]|uniref:Uncharacterized protein n=1 Tax=Mycena albidolilacea TaxID=1033008 RepID=A0AAD7EUQ9_9AGAR|nr:hypothetical protein DFH08DRAFT_805571 [Mycena albidolilacea]
MHMLRVTDREEQEKLLTELLNSWVVGRRWPEQKIKDQIHKGVSELDFRAQLLLQLWFQLHESWNKSWSQKLELDVKSSTRARLDNQLFGSNFLLQLRFTVLVDRRRGFYSVIAQVLLPRKTPMGLFQVQGQTKLKKPHARKPSAQVMEEEAILIQVLAAKEEDARPDGGTIEIDSEL